MIAVGFYHWTFRKVVVEALSLLKSGWQMKRLHFRGIFFNENIFSSLKNKPIMRGKLIVPDKEIVTDSVVWN